LVPKIIMIFRRLIRIIMVFCLFLSLLEFNIQIIGSAPNTVLIFDPAYIEVTTNGSFIANVLVVDVVNLTEFALNISFNSSCLEVLSIEVQPPFEKVYEEVTSSSLQVGGSLAGGEPPQSGTVHLITLSFRALSAATTLLRFQQPIFLLDYNGSSIPCDCSSYCTIVINPRIIIVPDDYPTIQKAVNISCPGDTIYVKAGNYSETVNVNKTLKIIGEDWENTIVQGGFRIVADNVLLTNFTITASGQNAIEVYGYNVTIQHNLIEHSSFGILFDEGSDQCRVSENIIRYCSADGIGIGPSGGSYHVVSNNNVANCSGAGISVLTPYNSILNNFIANVEVGIALVFGGSNEIRGNIILNNGWSEPDYGSGIVVAFSSFNKIIGNVVENNRRGMYIDTESWNLEVVGNSFVNNSQQIYFTDPELCSVVWDYGYPAGGNYWSDYDGFDYYWGPHQNLTGWDGIGDNPYIIDANASNVDKYPLMKPHNQILHDIAIESININASVIEAGNTVKIEVLVKNLGDKVENSKLTIYANDAALTTKNVMVLPNNTKLVIYDWQANVLKGNYTIWAKLGTLENEANISNNIKVAGVINVATWHNIAVKISMPKTQYAWGETAKIGITIENQGDYPEIINVTIAKSQHIFWDRYIIPIGIYNRSIVVWWGESSVLHFNLSFNNPTSFPRDVLMILTTSTKDPATGVQRIYVDPITGEIVRIEPPPPYKTVFVDSGSQVHFEINYPPIEAFSIKLYLTPMDNVTGPLTVSLTAMYEYSGSFHATYGPSQIGTQTVVLENGTTSSLNFEWTPDAYLPFSGYLGLDVFCPAVKNEFKTEDNEALATFYINEPPQLYISDVTLSDQSGNIRMNYTRGEVIQLNFTVTNMGDINVESFLIAVMVLDPSNTSQLICYTFDSMANSTGKFIFGFRVPYESSTGTYIAKVMIFTDWPSNGGIGLDVEILTFNIS